jgi:hypothetical protein
LYNSPQGFSRAKICAPLHGRILVRDNLPEPFPGPSRLKHAVTRANSRRGQLVSTFLRANSNTSSLPQQGRFHVGTVYIQVRPFQGQSQDPNGTPQALTGVSLLRFHWVSFRSRCVMAASQEGARYSVFPQCISGPTRPKNISRHRCLRV